MAAITILKAVLVLAALQPTPKWETVTFKASPSMKYIYYPKVTAKLIKPQGQGPFPAVVLIHGTRGMREHHYRWINRLSGWGYVALLVDSIGMRARYNPDFDPVTIRRSSKKLALSTEASYRFERGIDIEGVDRALKRSLMLISQLAGGDVAKGIIDCYQRPWSPTKIILRSDRTNKILGTNISAKKMAEHLSSIGMGLKITGKEKIEVSPPSFRVDISREADLIEEVARLIGYDNIPVTLPAVRPMQGDTYEGALRDRIKIMLTGMGFLSRRNVGYFSIYRWYHESVG